MSDLISIRRIEGGVALVVLDANDAKVNTITTQLGEELSAAIEQLAGDTACAGVVIISGKPESFIVGADIEQLSKVGSAAEGQRMSGQGHEMLDRLEELKIPVVAAIHGNCLGGGLELALACHARICTDHKSTVLGLPEIQLGLIPGAGGTQRLPRLVGVQAALDMILTAKNIRPRKALKMGLVDEVVPRAALEQAAAARVLKLATERKADEKRNVVQRELEELRRYMDREELTELLLGGNPLGRLVVFRKAGEVVQSKTRGHYPAPFAALRAVETGLAKGMKKGLAAEAEEFGKLVVSDVSRRLVELYYATQAIKKDTGVANPKIKPGEITHLGVLGGGLMGAGIAYVSANRGVEVRIKERDHEAGAKALAAVWGIVKPQIKRKRYTRNEAEQLLSRISATTDLSGFGRSQLVIEAVFEDLELKQRLLKEVEGCTAERCVFASNTSSLPITKIAEAAKRPQQVLGMHFFSPVHKMPLLEVIVTKKTADQATATAVAFGKRLGKQVIVVRDGVGFYTSRILAPYMMEAARILAEGAAVDAIDRALVDFGFPVGPVTLMDEVGIDVGEKVARIMYDAYGERMRPEQALAAVVADNRMGRKNKRGFYVYGEEKKKKKQVDETVYDLLPGGGKRRAIDVEEVQRRVALQMVNEAMHCMGDGILRSPRDGDIGAIFGLGFPPFLGGPFRYVDVRGADQVVDDLKRLADKFGPRFEPAPALVEAASDNRKFRD
jgi:3-hydroxyacyl-CoA dehydrogenase/enoyl-CoA hydratase/3-hydroxybutyryl-CoA epimerase